MVFSALLQRVKAMVQILRERFVPKRKRPVDDGRLGDVLEMLERDAWLTGEMLDELREASRVGERSPLHRASHVDLPELVRSTLESFAPLAREGEVTLTSRCAASSIIISADARDLTQIVGRLLACSIRSSGRGGRVDCQLSLDPDWICLVVRVHDTAGNGPRTPADFDASRFTKFGLPAVRKLVDLHGGVFRVGFEGRRSSPIFTVLLPGDRAIARPVPADPPAHHWK
jgi:signal transduction histidine kinase